MRNQSDCSKVIALLALLTFGNGTNILFLKSSGMYPDLKILLIKFFIISIPFSPMPCRSSAEMLSSLASLWQILDHSFNLFAADIYLIHQITHISASRLL